MTKKLFKAFPEQGVYVVSTPAVDELKAELPLTNLIFNEKYQSWVGKVPLTLDSFQVLTKQEFTPLNECSPMQNLYAWPLIKGMYKPMAHQVATAKFLTEHPRAFCTNQPRTGKTASVIMAQDFLRQQGEIKSTLIVAPMSCLKDVWESELFGVTPAATVAVLHGDKKQRISLLNDNYDVFIINPDGIKVIEDELINVVVSGKINCIVFDEITDFTNTRSQRWKVASKIARNAKYVWGLTGTPGKPLGIYGITKLVTPYNATGTFTWWRDHTMRQVKRFTWIPLTTCLEFIESHMQPTICFKKEDIMDLPPLQQFDREAPLSKEAHSLYELMRKASITEDITAANAAVQTSKLMQIATGAVKADDGSVHYLDIEPRIEVLLEIIEQTDFKVIIFAPFTAVLDHVKESLSPHYTCEIVDGRVTGRKRDEIFQRFRDTPDPHILLAHPKTMSFGLELSVADTVVFWGVPLNGTFVYQQAVERINSKLQKSKTPAVVHLHSTPVEKRLFDALQKGIDINGQILDLFKQIIYEQS